MAQCAAQTGELPIEDVTASVQLPLENLEFTIEQYLLANGARLDPETRLLLARVRDSVARIAVNCRRAGCPEATKADAGQAARSPACVA